MESLWWKAVVPSYDREQWESLKEKEERGDKVVPKQNADEGTVVRLLSSNMAHERKERPTVPLYQLIHLREKQ